MLLKDKHIGTFFAAVLLLASSAALMAAPAEKEGHLIITEVSVDYESSSMVIIGYDLDFGDDPLAVILGDTDITADCALDLPLADPQTITCSDLALPDAADLLLVVSNGNGAPQIDEYDLTFGAVGRQGDAGGPGPIGPPGSDGDSCSITECEPAHRWAYMTCGLDSVLVPCIPQTLLLCPCWNDFTVVTLVAAMEAFQPASVHCSDSGGDDGAFATARSNDPGNVPWLAASVSPPRVDNHCRLRLGPDDEIVLSSLPIPQSTRCLAEARSVVSRISWCPD